MKECNDCGVLAPINLYCDVVVGVYSLCHKCEEGEEQKKRIEEDEKYEKERLAYLEDF